MDENPITEEWELIEALESQESRDGLPGEVSLLRQKLSQKAKQEPKFRFYTYPRASFGEINSYVRDRLTQHLRRRSQRPFRPPEGVSFYQQLDRFGLLRL